MEPNQPNYADDAEYFAKEPPLQLTLRVMQAIYSNPKFWIGSAAVIAILTMAGPFNTLNDMEFAPRLVYWGAVALLTWPVGMACSIFFGTWFFQLGTPEWLARLFGGLIGGIPIAIIVWLINKFYAETQIGNLIDLARLTGYTTVISAAVSLIYYLVDSSSPRDSHKLSQSAKLTNADSAGQSVSETKGNLADIIPASPFFARLPVELGKDLISLQAQDHYIKATTTKGNEMILMRLADAEKELETVPGIRTHRSWWVAKKHIQETIRENEKLLVCLSNGQKIPVSRTYAKNIRNYLAEIAG